MVQLSSIEIGVIATLISVGLFTYLFLYIFGKHSRNVFIGFIKAV